MPRGSGTRCRENRKHILDEKSSAESSSEDSISTLFGILSSDDDSRSTSQANRKIRTRFLYGYITHTLEVRM